MTNLPSLTYVGCEELIYFIDGSLVRGRKTSPFDGDPCEGAIERNRRGRLGVEVDSPSYGRLRLVVCASSGSSAHHPAASSSGRVVSLQRAARRL